MNEISVHLSDISKTFTMISRHDSVYFLLQELPEFIRTRCSGGFVKLGDYVRRLRSGAYIPKASYSDNETDFVYLTIGNFSGPTVDLDSLVFLDESVGEQFRNIRVHDGDLIITRSGTVGAVHIFSQPDDKIYIPSHHLAVLELPGGDLEKLFLQYYLRSDFAKRFFWAFATGKSQKEISNWSIRSLPIPVTLNRPRVAKRCQRIEAEIEEIKHRIEDLSRELAEALWESSEQ